MKRDEIVSGLTDCMNIINDAINMCEFPDKYREHLYNGLVNSHSFLIDLTTQLQKNDLNKMFKHNQDGFRPKY